MPDTSTTRTLYRLGSGHPEKCSVDDVLALALDLLHTADAKMHKRDAELFAACSQRFQFGGRPGEHVLRLAADLRKFRDRWTDHERDCSTLAGRPINGVDPINAPMADADQETAL